jgi:hypothetical protein
MFHEQLFFDIRTQDGDSGAAVVHANTNTVIGLVAGKSGKYTIACPLYRKNWRSHGLKTVDGITLPDLRSK